MGALGINPPRAERSMLGGSEEGCAPKRVLSLLAKWCSRCSLWWWDVAAAGHLQIFQVRSRKNDARLMDQDFL